MGMRDEFEDLDFEEMDIGEGDSPDGGGNRTFLIVAGILGGILLLALIAIAAYAVIILPGRETAQQTQVAAVNATNTAIVVQSEQTAEAKQAEPTDTNTPTAAPATDTPEPTATATPVVAPTKTPAEDTETPSPETATVAALLTQQAEEGEETPQPTATELPDTGFADDLGVPGLLAVAGVLLIVIFLSRRLRSTSR